MCVSTNKTKIYTSRTLEGKHFFDTYKTVNTATIKIAEEPK